MRIFLSISLCCLLSIAYSQSTMKVTLSFMDNQGAALGGAKITLKETANLGKVELTTTPAGVVTTTLTTGKEWAIFVNGFQMRKMIEMPERGNGEMSMMETYDPEMANRLTKQIFSRDGFVSNTSEYVKGSMPPDGYNVVAINVVDRNGKVQADLEVSIVDVAEKSMILATTDYKGNAWFWVKSGKSFDIDVAGIMNVSYADMPDRDGLQITETIRYQPPLFTQTIKNDTIVQELNGITEPATGFQYFKLEVIKGGLPAVNEDVYLWDVKGTQVFQGATNSEGILEMMLPIRKKYMVDFNYEKDVDVVDLTMSYGGSSSTRSMLLTYVPNPKLEHPELFIPKSDEIFLKDFHAFATKQFPKKKKIGIHASFQGKINKNSKEAVLEIGVNTNFKPATPKLNISIVIDKSGSMAGYDRIERLKDALMQMIPKLPTDATLSILTYDELMTVVLPPQKIGTNGAAIISLINDIQPGGGTSMLESMQQAYTFVTNNYNSKLVNKVILMTDGWDMNEVQVLEDAQKPYSNIECSAVGIGQDFNYALLSILATNGKGKLFYVDSEGSYDSVFVNGMIASLSPVATDVTVEVEYNEKIVYKQLYGYHPVATDKNPAVFKIPNLYPESCELALAKFDLINPDSTIENQPVIIRVKYTNPETGLTETETEKVYLDWEPYTGELEMIADAENKKLYCIAVLNQSIKVMADQFAAGNTEEAKNTIQRAKEQVKAIYPEAKDQDVKKLLNSVEEYLEAFKNLAKKKHN